MTIGEIDFFDFSFEIFAFWHKFQACVRNLEAKNQKFEPGCERISLKMRACIKLSAPQNSCNSLLYDLIDVVWL